MRELDRPSATEGAAVILRPVERADVPAVVALVAQVLGEFGLSFGDGSETDAQLQGLPESYSDSGGAFWVATIDRRVVGTVGVHPVAEGVLELRKMYLAPEARGLGLGQRLLAAALGFAKSKGARALVLDTTEQMREARAFYEKNGFVRDDTQVRGSRCSRGYRLDLDT